MDSVLRAASLYVFLMIVVRLSGRRTLGQMTNFDFVLVLIISEATQNAMLGDDFSMTNGFLVILTLIAMDIGLSLWKQRSPRLELWIEGTPTILVDHGRPLADRLERARVDPQDILKAARELQGLERMDQIKYAVLERSGTISIIPAEPARGG